MRSVTFKISECIECPYRKYLRVKLYTEINVEGIFDFCLKYKRNISVDIKGFPSFCKLKQVKLYTKGKTIKMIEDIALAIKNNQLIYIDKDNWISKIRSPKVIINFSVIILLRMINDKQLYIAEKN